MKATTNANVTIELPNVVQNSSNPIQGGKFRVKCVDPDGFWSFSTDLYYMSSANDVKNAINAGCDRLNDDGVYVQDMGGYPYSDNGRRFWIRFDNKNVRNG